MDGHVTAQERQQLRADVDGLRANVERMNNNRNAGTQQNSTPGIDRAEYNIHARIAEGVRTGQINQREANRLCNREVQIERHEARFKADSVVTEQERRQLRNELRTLSEQVDRMMSNDNYRRG